MYPSKEQKTKLWLHANKLNWMYNQFLNIKISAYKTNKTTISRYDLQKQIKNMQQIEPILNEIHSQVLQQVTYRLDKTFQQFFRKNGGFPNYRSCKEFFGICYPQGGYKIEDNVFTTKIYGKIEFIKHRDICGNIKTITIKCENDKWFLSITTDGVKQKQGSGIIGVDVGITNLVALSDGKIVKNKTHAKYFDKQINKLKSRRDKCNKGSRKAKYLTKVVQRLYGVKNRKIDDFQHKVSKNLSSNYDTIIVEDLDVKKMSEGKITGLNREIRNSKLSSFIDKLQYKTKNLIKVNPRNTSKTCNCCGKIQDMPLSKRDYICSCGNKDDRDVNSAKNILCLGQAILSGVCVAGASLQEAPAFGGGSSLCKISLQYY